MDRRNGTMRSGCRYWACGGRILLALCAGSVPLQAQDAFIQASGGVSEMLIIGPIDPGRNTSPSGLCSDGDRLATVDYLASADGSVGERNLLVFEDDEVAPDFLGTVDALGVKPAANLDINPDGIDGILTVWRADADFDGYISFDDFDNVGAVDDYVIYSLVYLENTSGECVPGVLEVGSDDAVKVLLNGVVVHVNNVCRAIPAAGTGDRIPVVFWPGVNVVLISVVERAGETGVRLIVRDTDDLPFTDGTLEASLTPPEEYIPGSSTTVVRTISPRRYQPAQTIAVTLTASSLPGAIQVVETFPEGWSVSANPNDGDVVDNTIRFDLDADDTVSYELSVPDGVCERVSIDGAILGAGDCAGSVGGDSSLACSTSELIAVEPFDYEPGELAGLDGGEGDWLGPWTAVAALTEIVDTTASPLTYDLPGGDTIRDAGTALELIGNDDNIIFRQVDPPQDGDDVFVSFLLRFSGFVDANDFLGLWFDQIASGTHPNAPSIGLKGNQNGGGPLDIFARIVLNSETYAEDIVPGSTYFIVGYLSKETPGPTEPYTRYDLWVNPGIDDLDTPHATAFGFGLSSFTQIGIRVPTFDPDDRALLAQLRLGTSWEDVVGPVSAGGEVCDNSIDDDGDQLVDCADPDCAAHPGCDGVIFRRGDTDGNGRLEITDPINSLAFQFLGTSIPSCKDAADFDDNGRIEITDPIANLSHQFLGQEPPPAPGQENCGIDPTPDDANGNNVPGEPDDDLGCEAYPRPDLLPGQVVECVGGR